MSLYMFYLLSPVIFSITGLSAKKRETGKRRYLRIMFIVLFTFFALRTPYIGSGDARFYYNLWERFSSIPFSNIQTVLSLDLEKGYVLVTWLLSQCFHNGQYVFVFSGIFFALSITNFLKKNCDDCVLGLISMTSMGLCTFFLQGIRQAIAICICLYAIEYCKKRNIRAFLAVVIVAMTFHASAAVFVISYFIYGRKIDIKSIAIIALISAGAPIILRQVTILANFLMNENYLGGSIENTSGGVVTFILYLTIILYAFVLYNSISIRNSKSEIDAINYSFYFFMFVICTTFFSMRFFYITVFERASYYFLPCVAPLLDASKKNTTKKNEMILSAVLLAVFILLGIYKAGPSSIMSSYKFFWYN